MQLQVRQFHQLVLPHHVTIRDQYLKLVEEVGELAKGLHKQEERLITDAIGDTLYVLIGIANLHGIDLGEVFTKIHDSNMTKTRDGSLSPKGPNYQEPQL